MFLVCWDWSWQSSSKPTKMGIFHLSNGVANFTDEENVFLAPLSKTPPPERSVQQHSLILKACSVIFLLRLLITRHGYQTTIYKSKKLIIPLISCITCQRRSIFHSGENGMAAKIGLWIVLVGWSIILFLCVCRGRIAVFLKGGLHLSVEVPTCYQRS